MTSDRSLRCRQEQQLATLDEIAVGDARVGIEVVLIIDAMGLYVEEEQCALLLAEELRDIEDARAFPFTGIAGVLVSFRP